MLYRWTYCSSESSAIADVSAAQKDKKPAVVSLVRLALLARGQEAVHVAGEKEDAPDNGNKMLELDIEVQMVVPGQDGRHDDPVDGGTLHVLVGVIGGGPVEGDEAHEGGSAPSHDPILPLVELVDAVLEVVGHEKVRRQELMEAEDGQEDGAGLEGILNLKQETP